MTNTAKERSCEERIEEHQEGRMEQILPDLDSLQNCFDYYCGYNTNDSFWKETTGLSENDLINEWLENWVKDTDDLDETEQEEKASGLNRSDNQLDSDFDEWVWDNYEDDITDFIRNFHQERLCELPLAISKTVQYRIELSWGGPQDYICLDWDPEGKSWTGGSYHFLDWFDGARRTFGYELAEQIAEAFSIYPDCE